MGLLFLKFFILRDQTPLALCPYEGVQIKLLRPQVYIENNGHFHCCREAIATPKKEIDTQPLKS